MEVISHQPDGSVNCLLPMWDKELRVGCCTFCNSYFVIIDYTEVSRFCAIASRYCMKQGRVESAC
jgi:hypothetical protein